MRSILALLLFSTLGSLQLFAAGPPKDWPPEFTKTFFEAATAFNQRDFETTIAKLDAAEKIKPDVGEVANLRGAVKIEEKKFDEGLALFQQALKLDPNLYSAKFNVAEVPFLQRKYAEARKGFEALRESKPKDELVQFKIFLTYLLEKEMEQAQRELDKLTFPSDTPAYYFAHAAWEFAHDRPDEARKWMESSVRIFPAAQNVFYATTMYELGWVKERPVLQPAP